MFNASGAKADAACYVHSPAAGGQEQSYAFYCAYLDPHHHRAHSRALTHDLTLVYSGAYCLPNTSGLAHSNA